MIAKSFKDEVNSRHCQQDQISTWTLQHSGRIGISIKLSHWRERVANSNRTSTIKHGNRTIWGGLSKGKLSKHVQVNEGLLYIYINFRYLCGLYVKKDVVGGLLALLYFRDELLRLTGLGICIAKDRHWFCIFFRYNFGKNLDAVLLRLQKYFCLRSNQTFKQQMPISSSLGIWKQDMRNGNYWRVTRFTPSFVFLPGEWICITFTS